MPGVSALQQWGLSGEAQGEGDCSHEQNNQQGFLNHSLLHLLQNLGLVISHYSAYILIWKTGL